MECIRNSGSAAGQHRYGPLSPKERDAVLRKKDRSENNGIRYQEVKTANEGRRQDQNPRKAVYPEKITSRGIGWQKESKDLLSDDNLCRPFIEQPIPELRTAGGSRHPETGTHMSCTGSRKVVENENC